MSTRTNIVLDNDLIAQAMLRAGVTTKKAAVEAALKAYVRKPDYPGWLALRGKGLIDPDYDPRGPYGLTQAALERRGWTTFADARTADAAQMDTLQKPARKSSGVGVLAKTKALLKPVAGTSRARRKTPALDAA